ncbi:uncharacterized protein MKZ38_007368 [Zalerion maritima]|uniref:Uncharacterized protein n=1 Tax=Zalerion maritima TaxID=339359 RepID=A0AAD5RJ14_9PEZI|nr:uncharacterized protein MKZ38_007368 [Zalerion maritima]
MTRTTVAITVIAISTVLTVAGASYRYYPILFPQQVPGPGLHRSNAVRRRRRSRGHLTEGHDEDENENDNNPNVNPETLRILHDGETVVDDPEPGLPDDWWNDASITDTHQRAGQNIVSLLFRVSEDNARRNACVHRGCACNACGTVPIRGIRYRCANCADFDLCETCEAQGLHNKTHIFYKVKVPAPPFGPRSMQPVWYPGDPDQCLSAIPKALIPKLTKETGFERPELDAFWEQWTFMANTEWRHDPDELHLAMDRKTFERCLAPSGGYKHAAPNLIHDRMFAFYDSNRDGLIGFTEFLHGLAYRKRKEKLRKIFEGYDIDADGFVNRRDFLRMFRAYYVLYKQMHRDILEGLDDQVMSSLEAQQLVSGRQPLSGLFGRESRVPNGDPSRHVEGKLYDRTGDVHITDGRARAVNEDTQDTAPRDEILSSLFSREAPRMQTLTYELTTRSRRDSNPNYWEGLIDTPRQVSELPQLLVGESRQLSDIFNQVAAAIDARESDNSDSSHSSDEENKETSHSNGDDVANEDSNNGRNSNANGANTNGESSVEGDANGTENNENDPNSAPPVSHRNADRQLRELRTEASIRERLNRADRKRRAAARRQLHERWKRRQFYLDEEEGGRAPEDWESDEDVLEGQHIQHRDTPAEDSGPGEGSSYKFVQRPVLSPRSRSSSKVRFAEDTCTDDYEIRSNPSTSSRSVPERWGGFDIPEAERDAGKEILYQVTQQAFNELLDVIFKEKEDLSVKCAETRRERNVWRPLSSTIDLAAEDRKAKLEEDSIEDTNGQGIQGRNAQERRHRRHSRHWTRLENDTIASGSNGHTDDPFTDADGHRNPEEQPLEELLSVSGYSISIPDEDGAAAAEAELAEDRKEDEGVDLAANGDGLHITMAHEAEPVHRDPTLPQFRPNTVSEIRPQAHFAERAVVLSQDSQQATLALSPADSSLPVMHPTEVESPIIPSASEENDDDSGKSSSASEAEEDDSEHRYDVQNGEEEAEAEEKPANGEDNATKASSNPAADETKEEAAMHTEEDTATSTSKTNGETNSKATNSTRPKTLKSAQKQKHGKKQDKGKKPLKWYDMSSPPERSTLVEYRRLDQAEEDSRRRGGWGKLSFEEFDEIYKRQEMGGNRLDYLGSWIDFCIP